MRLNTLKQKSNSSFERAGCNNVIRHRTGLKMQLIRPIRKAGVREYWIVSTDEKEIEVHLFETRTIKNYVINEPGTPN